MVVPVTQGCPVALIGGAAVLPVDEVVGFAGVGGSVAAGEHAGRELQQHRLTCCAVEEALQPPVVDHHPGRVEHDPSQPAGEECLHRFER